MNVDNQLCYYAGRAMIAISVPPLDWISLHDRVNAFYLKRIRQNN